MFEFSFSTYQAPATHLYNRIKRNIQQQRNRGVQIQQPDPFENEDESSDTQRKKTKKPNQSSSKRKTNDENNTTGTSRGKKAPAVPYGGRLVINTLTVIHKMSDQRQHHLELHLKQQAKALEKGKEKEREKGKVPKVKCGLMEEKMKKFKSMKVIKEKMITPGRMKQLRLCK